MKIHYHLANVLLLTASAHAASSLWNASPSGNWDTPSNWTPNTVPAINFEAVINNGATVTKTGDLSLNDTLGSLTFGKTNYSDLAPVQALITSNHLRKDAAITETSNIADNGTSWIASFVSFLAEPSTLLLGALVLLPLLRRKR